MSSDSPAPASVRLVWPALGYLGGYLSALERGWSPDNVRGAAAAREDIEKIARDPERFLKEQVDRDGRGEPITLPDGSKVPRLPGYRRWLWDGEFCGVIGLRWQPGTPELPPYCLGHIGYSVVPWKRGRGYATSALRQLLPEAKQAGLACVDITTDPENVASQRVVLDNGGSLVGRFIKPVQFGGTEGLRFRITLDPPPEAEGSRR